MTVLYVPILDMLTPRQHETLAVIDRLIRERGYAPSVREVMRALGLHSSSVAHAMIARLESDGMLQRGGKGLARTMRLTARARQVLSAGRRGGA